MNTTVEIPKRLQLRPQFRGMPIPFTFMVIDGVPDFSTINTENWAAVVTTERCGLCGIKLGRHKYFIGGPQSCTHGHFYDPAMHEDCARYALAVCPYLAMGKGYRSEKREGTREVQSVSPDAPDKFGLLHCMEYTPVPNGTEIILKAEGIVDVEWFEPKRVH